MQRAEGNLTTGAYIVICNLNGNESVGKAEAKGNGYQVLGTKDRNDENPACQWYFESLGNNRYRGWNKKSGTAFVPSTYAEGALIDQETEPIILIIRETETKGEYSFSFDEEPSWYVCPMGYGSSYKMSADPKQGPWSLFKVDN